MMSSIDELDFRVCIVELSYYNNNKNVIYSYVNDSRELFLFSITTNWQLVSSFTFMQQWQL